MSDCIIWHKSKRDIGYGQTFFRGKVMKAHRVAWIKVNGEIPRGLVVDHICHERNITVRKNGTRECAECNRVRARANYAKKKAGVTQWA